MTRMTEDKPSPTSIEKDTGYGVTTVLGILVLAAVCLAICSNHPQEEWETKVIDPPRKVEPLDESYIVPARQKPDGRDVGEGEGK